MASYMAEVAKMLGVELGEEFKCSNGVKYKFTNEGIMTTEIIWSKKVDETLFSNVLMSLLNGELTIMSKPWKPKYNGKYYSIGPGGVLEPGCWLNDFIDVAMYRLGNCYSTVKEAEANRDKWVKFYASDEVLEV